MLNRRVLIALVACGLVISSATPRRSEAVVGLFTAGWASVVVGAVGMAVGAGFAVAGAAGSRGMHFVIPGLSVIGFGILLLDAEEDGRIEQLRFGSLTPGLQLSLRLSPADVSAYEDERFELNAWVEDSELFLAENPQLSGPDITTALIRKFDETGFSAGTARVVRALLQGS